MKPAWNWLITVGLITQSKPKPAILLLLLLDVRSSGSMPPGQFGALAFSRML